MRNLLSQLLALGPELAAFILTTPLLLASAQSAIPSPNLKLDGLGRVAIAGDFDSIQLYTYEGQSEASFNTNGSQSLLKQYPDGSFESLAVADAYITTMCPFIQQDGSLAGVIVGGNFTSLGGVEAQGIALYNPNTTQITALPGLSGKVNSVYCDDSSGTVYVGGEFMGGNSTNALAWTTGWTNLPFAGFNGAVNSITKDSAGNIVFGGDFSGLGNTTTPNKPDGQVINLGSGDITASGSTETDGFSDPSNIICKTAAEDGAGNTWLLADNTAGWWEGNFSFGFVPTKMRLYNTLQDDRGTKTFYFENLNSGGILNLMYLDTDGQNQSCSSSCPLPQDNSTYQDFHFDPPVGTDAFRIYITDWYGNGGGLSGIEMFQDDIYSFAVNDFNEPDCDGVSNGSSSAVYPGTGLWERVPNNGNTSSDYLSAYLTDASNVAPSTSVVFTPNIEQSGNYSITVYTPGCLQDNSCDTRGTVNVTGTMTSSDPPVTTILYQTNNYDKFDQVYFGYVDVDTDTFQPSVTLSPEANQGVPLTVVAQRVRFELITSTGGLNGLFEYNPNKAVVSTDFSNSAIDSAGTSLDTGAVVNAVVQASGTLYAAGSFNASDISNILSVSDNATALPNGGLNASILNIYANESMLYVGGNFTNTADGSVSGLNNVAMFDISSKEWSALGAGVDGTVYSLVPISLNITGSEGEEECLTVNGDFTSVYAFDGHDVFNAEGFAIWVPSHSNWLNNIKSTAMAIHGKLTAYTDVPGYSTLYAGQISSQGLDYSGAVELAGNGQPTLQSLGINLATDSSSSSNSSSTKRALTSTQNFTGVYEALFYNQSNYDIAILGGRFSATASNGSTIENLMFINDTSSRIITGVTGLDSDSTFMAMDYYETKLYAGGAVSGTVNGNSVQGLIVYDFDLADFAATQPPELQGDNVVVHAVAIQPNSANVFVGGDFTSAGSLPCATLCYYDASTMQWNTPGAGLTGTITSMIWSSNSQLIVAGNLTVDGVATTMATYDAKKETFTQFTGASTLPGPITAITPANNEYDQFWAAGTATSNGSAYLSKYDSNQWTGVGGLSAGTLIRGLQVLTLTSNHDSSNLLSNDETLLLTGNINVPDFGNASAALFNGTTFQPFILTNRNDGSQGTLSGMFVENSGNLMSNKSSHLALGLVVLIGLAIALALVFLIVVAGILIERHRRRKEGYVPMQMEKSGNLQRIPPETLLGGLSEKDSPPKL